MSQSTKQKPVHEIRLGSTKATIWPNNSEKGIRYNVTVSRGYHDGKGWKETQSFGRDDLPRLIKCADLAYQWIFSNNGNAIEDEPNLGESGKPAGQY